MCCGATCQLVQCQRSLHWDNHKLKLEKVENNENEARQAVIELKAMKNKHNLAGRNVDRIIKSARIFFVKLLMASNISAE